MPDVIRLWGKTAGETYHPALFHMIDVGNVASLLLSDEGLPRARETLRHALSSNGDAADIGWTPFVTSLHDLGKISAPFQRQVDTQRERLEKEGFTFESPPHSFRHRLLSGAAVNDVVRVIPQLAPLKRVLRDVWSGHHGVFSPSAELKPVDTYTEHVEPPMWSQLRAEAINKLKNVFPFDSESLTAPANLRRATAALTGFVILCDWIGSDQNYFTPEPAKSLEEYRSLSAERARRATIHTGLLQPPRSVEFSGFQSVFPTIAEPRPLQLAIDELPDRATEWPALYVIEAPTGEGKTEAALALARRIAQNGWSDEFYFALPTMATSNQMFLRVLEFLESVGDGRTPARLVHGQAMLFQDALVERAYGDERDAESPAHSLANWFAPRKRALLAPFGVGTVDQAELAVLNARHYVLRLFGLAGKTVIIDEVHAYDTYMSTIIDHALWWFGVLGTSVILLSATLPQRRHRQMAEAYRRGASDRDSIRQDSDAGNALPYPLLAAYPRHAEPIMLTPQASQPERELNVTLVPALEPDREAERLLDLVRDGGAVCRLSNTVASTQDIYASLARLAPDNVEQYLLHARFPGEDRLQREQTIVGRLGRESTRVPSDRIIVVGTQVLEQSLDLDFDVMVTDHAPTDLLLQRAGRMHRHPGRARPAGLSSPHLLVSLNLDTEQQPQFGPSEFVYEPFILWKSWLTLRARQDSTGPLRFQLPADYRPLIESTYDNRLDVLPKSSPGYARFMKSWNDFVANQSKLEDEARLRLIPDPVPNKPIAQGAFINFEEDEDGGTHGWGFAATRSGEESISLIPLHRVADGVALRPDGPPLTAVSRDREQQLELLRRSLRVSNQAVVKRLPNIASQELPWFGRIPLLRYYSPLILDDNRKEIGNVTLVLDDELGLVIQ